MIREAPIPQTTVDLPKIRKDGTRVPPSPIEEKPQNQEAG